MRRRERNLALGIAAMVLMALLAVFALSLSGSFSKSRSELAKVFYQRAQLVSASTSSLFQAASAASQATNARTYGARHVSAQALNAASRSSSGQFGAVLDSSDRILAASNSLTASERANLLAHPPMVAAVLAGQPIWLSDALPIGPNGASVLEFAEGFTTPYGRRVVVSGNLTALLGTIFNGALASETQISKGQAYIVDSHATVISGASAAVRVGDVVPDLQLAAAVKRAGTQGAIAGERWYATTPIAASQWRTVLVAPERDLFSSVSGSRKLIPWIIFIAFALTAGVALIVGRRALRASEEIVIANGRLEAVNTRLDRRAIELERSNAELDQFASIASHDLQEPLRKVRTFIAQLSDTEGDVLSERGRDYLQRANAATERMQSLIEDLLRYARIATQGQPFVTVDLAKILHEVTGDLEAVIDESGAQLHIGALPTISADAPQMRQLFQNLISNALKFCCREGVSPEVWIESHVGRHAAEITVRDNGIGFDPQYRTRIFRVFERLHGHDEYSGTGIGLALCRKIAERHHGTILADSTPDVGSSFTVTLPLEQPDEGSHARVTIDEEHRERGPQDDGA